MVTGERFDYDTSKVDDGILIVKGNPATLKQVFDSGDKVYCQVDTWSGYNSETAVLELHILVEKRKPDHKTQHEFGNA